MSDERRGRKVESGDERGRVDLGLVREHFAVRRDQLREIADLRDGGQFITVRGQRFWLTTPSRTGHFTAQRAPAWKEYLVRPLATIRRYSLFEELDSWRFKKVRREVLVADGAVEDRDIVVIQAAETAPALRGTGFALEMLKTVLRQGYQECFVQGEAPNESAIRWQSFDQLRLAIVSWIERTYHRRRRQARLGKLTPVEFEMVQSVQAAAAA